ncbi:MAG TPA: hypothetical protein VGJ91_07335, partial [Polyangiaceae bacterium]
MRPFSLLALLVAFACKSTPPTESTATVALAPTSGVPPSGVPTVATDHSVGPRIVEPHGLTPLAQGRSALGPYSLQVPADWKAKPSVSNMRAAEFELPTSEGQAEVIVYYFGESGAGSVQANIDRWVSQFTQPDGKPSSEVTKVEQATFAGQAASLVSLSGHYAARAMPGGEAVDKADQSLLA